jgi:hypothetical protein
MNYNGHLKELWRYGSEGQITYSVDELNTDPIYKVHACLEYFNIIIAAKRDTIIDGDKLLPIEKIYENKRLTVVATKTDPSLNGRRIIYAFE